MGNPKVVARGEEAHRRASRLLQSPSYTLVHTSLGVSRFQSGMILFSKRLIVTASFEIGYMEGDTLYVIGSSDLARDEYFIALSKGAGSAVWTIQLAEVEVTLLTGIFCPWYLLLGVSAVKTTLFYHANKMQCDKAFRLAPRIISNLNRLRQKHSTLFRKMASSAGRDILLNLPKGITAEDVAFFVGRCIKGIYELPEATFRTIMLCVRHVAILVAAVHMPFIVFHTASHEAKQRLTDLKTNLMESGININDLEALQILKDIKADPEIEKTLKELETDFQQLVPILNTLKGFMRAGE